MSTLEDNMRKNLNEITIMRPLIILGIIVMHSVTKTYLLGGACLNSYPEWFWVGTLLDSYIVAAFVFISGYLFSYQRKICSFPLFSK